ncbi:MAG: hypothetical protein U0W40_16525 [Acidimicrobiia bacterium]
MNDQYKWVNQFQPQTLYLATILCYIDAVFGLFNGFYLLNIVIVVCLGIGGFGIANEKRWGYFVGVIGAILQVIVLIAIFRGDLLKSLAIISLGFDIALVALLLHPQSREYQRIWFK